MSYHYRPNQYAPQQGGYPPYGAPQQPPPPNPYGYGAPGPYQPPPAPGPFPYNAQPPHPSTGAGYPHPGTHGPPGGHSPQPQQPYPYPGNYQQPPYPPQPLPSPQHFQYPPQPPPVGTPQGPPQGYGAPPRGPSGLSPGYIPGQLAHGDFRREADALRKAMKGFGTDEKALIQVLSKLEPEQAAAVRATYTSHINRDLHADVKSETSGYFRQALLAIIDGPLAHDTALAREAVQGIGTKEWLLNDVLLGRSNADLNAIKASYERTFHRSIERDVGDDLSFKTKTFFSHVLRASRHEENTPYNEHVLREEVPRIHSATAARLVNNADEISSLFARCSNVELQALDRFFSERYHTSLEAHIDKEFSGHMKDALLHMIRTALDPAMRDAVLLEECMKGMGTKDERLVVRVVRVHWDRTHLANVKRAYQYKYNQDLVKRVKGETSGDYQRLLVAMLE
ncbi:hypothetical protein BDW62DRAFT_128667 [Aspergillus aurantiobrunneus]